MNVTSDSADTIHVHGYEIEAHTIEATIATVNVR